MPAHDPHPDCVFCRIVAGTIPAAKVYEDDLVLAFIDINPLADGHTLLIPKTHYESIYQMPADLASALGALLPRLARAVTSTVNAHGLNVLQNNGPCAGQAVSHLHFHLIPRMPGDGLGYRWPARKYPEGRLDEVCALVTRALANDKK